MPNRRTETTALLPLLFVLGCQKNVENTPDAAASRSTELPASASAPPIAPAASSVPAAPTSSAPAMRADCPKGSSGPGTFDKPCEAKGNARLMEVVWTGKTDEKGPHFRVTNKASAPILYGRIAVYYYDKAGKQLDVKDSTGKTTSHGSCGGNIFSGVMKTGEKAVLTFSCVTKESVPEHTAALEAEMQMVGFADETEKKSQLYWKNDDLAPDARKKGGTK